MGYSSYGRNRPDPAQLEWLHAVSSVGTAAGGGSSRYYGATPAWIQLEGVGGSAIWDLLAGAAEVGVALVGSDRGQQGVTLAVDPADLVVDVVRRGDGIGLEALLRTGDGSDGIDDCLMLGQPVRALVSWPLSSVRVPLRERALLLTRFRTPPAAELVSLLDAGFQEIPASDEQRFVGTYLPVLRQRVQVLSHDGSFEVPEPVPPQLLLTVRHLPGHRASVGWAWRYAGVDELQQLWPRFSPAAFRDLDREHEILAGLQDTLSGAGYLLERNRLLGGDHADRDAGGRVPGRRASRSRRPSRRAGRDAGRSHLPGRRW